MFGGQKSTFGSSGFGGSSFGSSNTNSGGGGLFGNTQQNNTGGGLFGSNNQQSNNSAFSLGGNTNTPSTGGLFGSNTNTSNSGGGGLFGGSSNTNNTSSGGLFGSTNNTNTFGSSSNTGGGLFGSTNTNTTNNTGGGLFGGGAGNNFSGGAAGTGTPDRFEPTIIKDTNPKGLEINTRLLCYSGMQKYSSKSLTELRIEDYMANRKAGNTSGGSSGGMFGSTNTTGGGGSLFGGGGSTNTFGSSNTQSSGGGLFGSNSTTNNTGGGLFGSNTNTSSGGLFGQNNTPNNSTGLFGNTTSSFSNTQTNTFGSSNTNNTGGGLFGQNNTSTSGGGGLFGNNTQTSTSGGLFGNTNTSSFGTTNNTTSGGGLFGNTNNQTNNSGSLFGNNNASKPGGLFGNTNTSTSGGLFGNTTQTSNSGGLFGNNAAKPATGGLFGNTSTSASGGGLFGNANNQNKTNSSFSFGNTTNNTTGGGLFNNTATSNTGGGLFGNNAAKPATGGLFGNTSSGGGLFGNTTNNASGGLFNNTASQPTAAAAVPVPSINTDAALSHLIQNPFGDSPLFRNVALDKAKLEEQLKPVSPAAQKASLQPQYKVTANQSKSVLTPKTQSPNRSLFIGLEATPGDNESTMSGGHLRPRQSMKKLSYKVISSRKMNDSVLFNSPAQSQSDSPLAMVTPRNGSKSLDSFDQRSINESTFIIRGAKNVTNGGGGDELEESITPLGGGLGGGAGATMEKTVDPLKNDFRARLEDSTILDSTRTTPIEEAPPVLEEHPAGIKLVRPDYYTKPALNSLTPDDNGDCWVNGLTIFRRNYGSIHWPGRINVARLDLDAIVDIKRKSVSVYPEEMEHLKPEVGTGLNQKADVSLQATFPVDKTTKETIKNPERLERMGWPVKLESATSKMGARFIDYDLTTGTWTFRVQHFSKYGLEDSDDEMDESEIVKSPPVSALPVPANLAPIPEKPKGLGGLGGVNATVSLGVLPGDETSKLDITSPREAISFLPTADSLAGCQKIQDMKYSLFGEGEGDENEKPLVESTRTDLPPMFGFSGMESAPPPPTVTKSLLLKRDVYQPLAKKATIASPFSATLISTQNTIGSPSVTLNQTNAAQISRRQRVELGPVPLEAQFFASRARQLQTAISSKLTRANGWRCSWSRNNQIGHGGATDQESATKSILASGQSRPKGFRLNLRKLGQPSVKLNSTEKENLTEVLDVLLKYSKINKESKCPHIEVDKDKAQELIAEINQLTQKQCSSTEESNDFLSLQSEISSLIVALWGTMELYGNNKLTLRERKRRLKAWIKKSVDKSVQSELENESDLKRRLLLVLSAGDIKTATKLAMESGLERLSVLIPLAGSEKLQLLLQRQLEQWHQTKLDGTIDENIFSVYQMLAGLNVAPKRQGVNGDIEENNLLSNMEWRRALGFFLQYGTTSACSIGTALVDYRDASESNQAARPQPRYKEKQMNPINGYFPMAPRPDVCYMLIGLFADRGNYCNGSLFAPDSYTNDLLDYRLVFLVLVLMDALDYGHSMDTLQTVLSSLAAQLETNGMWRQAATVQMMNPVETSREKTVREILSRNVSCDDGETECESFLKEIGLNPAWFDDVKAASALAQRDHEQAVRHMINGGFYNQAHNIIFNHLSSKWIVEGRAADLRELLQSLDRTEITREIENWDTEGSVFIDYFEVQFFVEELQAKHKEGELDQMLMVELDEMEPVLAGLVSRIGSLSNSAPMDVLARSEMARNALHWGDVRRAVLQRDADLVQLESLVRSARLPDDYVLEYQRRTGTATF